MSLWALQTGTRLDQRLVRKPGPTSWARTEGFLEGEGPYLPSRTHWTRILQRLWGPSPLPRKKRRWSRPPSPFHEGLFPVPSRPRAESKSLWTLSAREAVSPSGSLFGPSRRGGAGRGASDVGANGFGREDLSVAHAARARPVGWWASAVGSGPFNQDLVAPGRPTTGSTTFQRRPSTALLRRAGVGGPVGETGRSDGGTGEGPARLRRQGGDAGGSEGASPRRLRRRGPRRGVAQGPAGWGRGSSVNVHGASDPKVAAGEDGRRKPVPSPKRRRTT